LPRHGEPSSTRTRSCCLACRQGWQRHRRTQLLLDQVEGGKRVLEDAPFQRRDALEPMQREQRPLHRQHPLLRMLGRFRQAKAARRFGYMKANGPPEHDLPPTIAAD
jgi:hypothetical protein